MIFASILSEPVSIITKLVGGAAGGIGLSFLAPFVLGGTKAALEQVATLISGVTAPKLSSEWFSTEYLRVVALSAMLTVPFLFAAAVQAVLRAEPGLLAKVVFGYLPLALAGVTLAVPVTMLLLSATDEMCAIVAGPGASGGAKFLDQTAAAVGGLSAVDGSPFFAIVLGLFTLAAALMLTVELLVREAAVYVAVLMLPLMFASLVWPARRVWAVRLVELLISLILAKFVIVAVLSLAGAAWQGGPGVAPLLTTMSLLMLSTFAPWALMRLLPFTEVAAAAAGGMRHEVSRGTQSVMSAASGGIGLEDMAAAIPRRLMAMAQGSSDQGSEWSATAAAGLAGNSAAGAQEGGDPVATQGGGSVGADVAVADVGVGGASASTGGGAGTQAGAPVDAGGSSEGSVLAGTVDGGSGQSSGGGSYAAGMGSEGIGGPGRPTGPIEEIWDAPNFSWPEMRFGPGGLVGPLSGAGADGDRATGGEETSTQPADPPTAENQGPPLQINPWAPEDSE